MGVHLFLPLTAQQTTCCMNLQSYKTASGMCWLLRISAQKKSVNDATSAHHQEYPGDVRSIRKAVVYSYGIG